MQRFAQYARDPEDPSTVMPTVTVTVYLAGTTTKPTIYSTASGTVKANPFDTDTTGLIWFYAPDGEYDVVVSKTDMTSYTLGSVWLLQNRRIDVTSGKYAALGDGVIDDYAAVQSAIDDAEDAADASGYGVDVYCPPGQYRYATGLIQQHSKVRLIGAGPGASIFLGDAGVDVLTLQCPRVGGIDGSRWADFSILSGARGIVITDAAGATPPATYGLLRSTFARLVLANLTTAGISSDAQEILETSFRDCFLYDNACAIDWSGVTVALNALVFDHCFIRTSTGAAAIKLNHPGQVYFRGGLIESNQQVAVQILQPNYGVVFDGTWIEGNGTKVTGGPYSTITVEATQDCWGPIVFRGGFMDLKGSGTLNNNNVALEVLTDHVKGYLIFDAFFPYADPYATVKGASTDTPYPVQRQTPGVLLQASGTFADPHVDALQVASVEIAAAGALRWFGRGKITSPGDAYFNLEAAAGGGIPHLNFGTTLGDPSLRKSAYGLDVVDYQESTYKKLRDATTISPLIAEYADNAAAIAGGLQLGEYYRTGDALKVVHA